MRALVGRGCRPRAVTVTCDSELHPAVLSELLAATCNPALTSLSLLGRPQLNAHLAARLAAAAAAAAASRLASLTLCIRDPAAAEGAHHLLTTAATGRLTSLDLRLSLPAYFPPGLPYCTDLRRLAVEFEAPPRGVELRSLPAGPFGARARRRGRVEGRGAAPAVSAIASLRHLTCLDLHGPALGRLLDAPHRLQPLTALAALTALRIRPGKESLSYCRTAWRAAPLLPYMTSLADLDLGPHYVLAAAADVGALSAAAALTRLCVGALELPPPPAPLPCYMGVPTVRMAAAAAAAKPPAPVLPRLAVLRTAAPCLSVPTLAALARLPHLATWRRAPPAHPTPFSGPSLCPSPSGLPLPLRPLCPESDSTWGPGSAAAPSPVGDPWVTSCISDACEVLRRVLPREQLAQVAVSVDDSGYHRDWDGGDTAGRDPWASGPHAAWLEALCGGLRGRLQRLQLAGLRLDEEDVRVLRSVLCRATERLEHRLVLSGCALREPDGRTRTLYGGVFGLHDA